MRGGQFRGAEKTTLGKGARASIWRTWAIPKSARGRISARAITCNYDGDQKHQTQIGEGAFIGSNSTLVAPLEIGADSYVAAGSVITEDVPAKTLALGRARQVVKQGWVKKPRKK